MRGGLVELQAGNVKHDVRTAEACQACACGHQPLEFFMALSINTNAVSLNAQRNLGMSQSSLATSMQRLSSGLRVNSAKDDSAGLAIADRMNSQVRGNTVAIRNANDAISLSQTAEGAIGKIGDMLQRMRELAVQSSNATNTETDRLSLQAEYADLSAEIGRTITSTRFNNAQILTSTVDQTYQVGANNTDVITVTSADITAAGGLATARAALITGIDGTTARAAIVDIDTALTSINTERAKFGAMQNRFESVISTLQVAVENQSASRGRILDADFATETANLSRSQILQQAGTAMVAQANQLPQMVLSLIR